MACFACPISASRYLRISEGDFLGTEGEGFETNTAKNFGCKLDIDYLPAIIKAHILCSQYGLDVDNTAGPIAWAMECYEKGILKKEDLDGLELEWGNYEAVLELIRKIAYRDGVGDVLAEGSRRASEILGKGSQKYAMHIMGQDLYEELRASKGWALGVILSPTGGGHLRGAPIIEALEISPEEGERFYGVTTAGDRKTYEKKAKLVVYFQNFKAVVDAVGLCYILTQWSSPRLMNPEDISRLYTAAVGVPFTAEKLMRVGERIHNIEMAFNTREGITRKDYWPPERFFEPVNSGPGKGECLDKEKLRKAIDEYYDLRGWDLKTGLPTRSKLEDLGLEKITEDLEKRGKLA